MLHEVGNQIQTIPLLQKTLVLNGPGSRVQLRIALDCFRVLFEGLKLISKCIDRVLTYGLVLVMRAIFFGPKIDVVRPLAPPVGRDQEFPIARLAGQGADLQVALCFFECLFNDLFLPICCQPLTEGAACYAVLLLLRRRIECSADLDRTSALAICLAWGLDASGSWGLDFAPWLVRCLVLDAAGERH